MTDLDDRPVQSSPGGNWIPIEDPPSANPPVSGVESRGGPDPTPGPRKRPGRPAWFTRPPILATGGLGLAIGELAGYGLLGLPWLLAANAAAAVVVFGGGLAWRRKGKGGFLDRLLAGARQRTGTRTGGAGGGKWPGLFGSAGRGRRTSTGGGRAGGAAGRSAGGKRGGVLGKLTGGRLGRRSTAGRSGSTGGGGRSGGGGAAGGKRSGGVLGGLRSGGRRGAASGGRGSTGRRSAGGGLFGRRQAARSTGAGPGGKRSGWQQIRDGWRWQMQRKATQNPAQKAATGRAAAPTSTPATGPAQGKQTATGATTTPTPVPPTPRRTAGPTKEGNTMTDYDNNNVRYDEHQALQTWGANFDPLAPVAHDLAARYAALEADKERFVTVARKMRDQGDSELPASKTVVAALDSFVQRLAGATTSDGMRAAAADAETLPIAYRSAHAGDEERLHNPRNGALAEDRADTRHARSER